MPDRLAEKLHDIRITLGLTQEQMIERLGYKKTPLFPGHISGYERGVREPPLLVLLQYARLIRVPMEVLVDDSLQLPARFSYHRMGDWGEMLKMANKSESD
jgi:transcriptional regulator with XRE-family HTH domain